MTTRNTGSSGAAPRANRSLEHARMLADVARQVAESHRQETRYYHRRTDDGELLADVELGITAHNAIHEERFTGMSPFSWLRLSA